MNRIELEITAESPLALGRQKPGGSLSEVEQYIPGTVIRGAIASQMLQQSDQSFMNQTVGGDFHTLFVSDTPAIFQNAYSAIAKTGEAAFTVSSTPIRLLPATAVSSKTNSGFKPVGHGVFDTLIDSFCATAFNQPFEFTDAIAIREGTNAQVEPYAKLYSQIQGKYYEHTVSSRFLTRVGINRRRATAEEQVLYSIEVLNESFAPSLKVATPDWQNVVYHSASLVEDTVLAQALTQFINDNANVFRIGGSTSRGLGKIKIEAKIANVVSDVSVRMAQFQEHLKSRWQLWSVFGNPIADLLIGRTYFTIDLQADAILTEHWQRTTVISPAMLQQFTGVTDESLTLHIAYSSYNYRSGWNAAWGLMKDVELVTARGAVYLFSTTQPQLWETALEELEVKGIGDRTAEGFGQVRVCDEFHGIFREEPV